MRSVQITQSLNKLKSEIVCKLNVEFIQQSTCRSIFILYIGKNKIKIQQFVLNVYLDLHWRLFQQSYQLSEFWQLLDVKKTLNSFITVWSLDKYISVWNLHNCLMFWNLLKFIALWLLRRFICTLILHKFRIFLNLLKFIAFWLLHRFICTLTCVSCGSKSTQVYWTLAFAKIYLHLEICTNYGLKYALD